MKKLLFILLFMPLVLFAQDPIEPTDPLSIRIGLKPYHTGITTMDFASQQPIVLNVIFHYPDAIPGNLTETNFLSAIAYLNINFNKFNIFFKYRGFDNSNTIIDTMINIMVTDDGNTEPHGNTLNMRQISLPYQIFQNSNSHYKSLIAHEFGHICGLYHTFHGTDSTLRDLNIPLRCGPINFEEGNFPTYNNSSRRGFTENITRTTSDAHYNASTAGDFVVDTPATYRYPNLCNDIPNGISNYLVSNEVKDSTDNEYYTTIDTYNFMCYNDPHFLKNFTDGQGIRMRETLENEEGYDDIKTTVASLYQPYKIIEYPMQYFMQPGFDYEFVNCEAGCIVVSSDYENTSFNYNNTHNDNYSFNTLYTPYDAIYQRENMAFRILQIDDSQPRKCYSVITKGISGIVVTFNDNIINTNVTTSVLDSTAVNTPNLIQNLPEGLYIIKKNYDDGSQEQQTILKEDD